jgi:hypothetical protein
MHDFSASGFLTQCTTQCVTRFAAALALTTSLAMPLASSAQATTPMDPGRIIGKISGTRFGADTIVGANVLVNLWRIDPITTAQRDSACNLWRMDRDAWMRARGEVHSPSGVPIAQPAINTDVRLLSSLLASRVDTVRTDADGQFTFDRVPFGAYLVEAETFANKQVMQWTREAPVVPAHATRVSLDPTVLMENQYCAQPIRGVVASRTAASGREIYDEADLDARLSETRQRIDRNLVGAPYGPYEPQPRITVAFVVGQTGVPDLSTVKIVSTIGPTVTKDAAILRVRLFHYSVPMVHGKAVRARIERTITFQYH